MKKLNEIIALISLYKGECLVKWCKAFVIGVFFSHLAYAEEMFVTLEPVRDNQLDILHEEFPIADLEDYSTLTVRFQGLSHSEFSRVRSLRTNIEYSQVLTCNGIDYPMIMLNTDSSYVTGSYDYKVNTNRLYIYDLDFNRIKYDESTYSFTISFSSGSEFLEEHRFTLDNLDNFACSQVARELSPKSVEKAFATNKIYDPRVLKKGYSEYSIGKIKAMFEAYPLSKRNVTQYNNIAYYFEKHKAYEQSAYVLEKILDQYPTRTVAYINLGDAYWGLDKRIKAKAAYQKYVELMKANEREHKIPQKVLERVES